MSSQELPLIVDEVDSLASRLLIQVSREKESAAHHKFMKNGGRAANTSIERHRRDASGHLLRLSVVQIPEARGRCVEMFWWYRMMR
eukprot:scaffold2582_cov162-Ochromonas_danica.AAC.2